MLETKNQLIKKLNSYLATFTIPSDKKTDYKWLLENIHIKNTGHRNLNDVKKILIKILEINNENRKTLQ